MKEVDDDWIARSQGLTFDVKDFINGRRQASRGREQISKYGPRDGQLLAQFGATEGSEVDLAIDSARQAFRDGRWSRLSTQRRKDALYRLAALIETHGKELALLECLDVGKPIVEALNFDVKAAADTIRFSAEAADKFYGKVYCVDQSNLSYQLRRPVGVVAAIVGWNFPLLLAAAKVGPALAAGNSVVLKPSELTSFSAVRLAELAVEAGIPDGVLNVVHGGAKLGAALAHHGDVDLLTFTGSTRTGKELLIAAGKSNMKRLILECGGKAPNIVFDDSPDLEAVADAVVRRAFYNQGAVCTASSRLLIQQTIKDAFLNLVIDRAAKFRPGDPLKPETSFGAVVSRAHRQRVLEYIDRGRRDGARVAYQCDSQPPHEHGFYAAPIILDGVSPDQTVAQEEIFGPVLSVIAFHDEKEAIRIANETIYGLSAILWTKDAGRAHRVTQGVSAGWVVINATDKPVGGPSVNLLSIGGHKQSGIGAEGGLDGIEAYTNSTAVQCFV